MVQRLVRKVVFAQQERRLYYNAQGMASSEYDWAKSLCQWKNTSGFWPCEKKTTSMCSDLHDLDMQASIYLNQLMRMPLCAESLRAFSQFIAYQQNILNKLSTCPLRLESPSCCAWGQGPLRSTFVVPSQVVPSQMICS